MLHMGSRSMAADTPNIKSAKIVLPAALVRLAIWLVMVGLLR